MPSGELNKRFLELLVSKNDLTLLRNYYTGIKDQIITDLNGLYGEILSNETIVDQTSTGINQENYQISTMVNDFISNTTGDLIVNHKKYTELMIMYNKYIRSFYDRMTNLLDNYLKDFNKSEINTISNVWKFHYSESYQDASNVIKKFGSLNINKDSEIFELSSSRYLYRSNDNTVYDVNYKTKDVYFATLDSKVFESNVEQAKFITLFSAKGLTNAYAFITVGKSSGSNTVIKNKNDDSSLGFESFICKYDSKSHVFKIINNSNSFNISEKAFENTWNFVDSSYKNKYIYLYIGDCIYHIDTTTGIVTRNDINIPSTSGSIEISSVEIFGNNCYFVTGNDHVYGYPLNQDGKLNLNVSKLISSSFGNASTHLYSIFVSPSYQGGSTSAIFFVGISNNSGVDKNIIYTKEVTQSNLETVLITCDKLTIDGRNNNLSSTLISKTNLLKKQFIIDELGTFIYLSDNNKKLNSISFNPNGTVDVKNVPTKYVDKIINLTSLESSSFEGYVNKSENLFGSRNNVAYAFINIFENKSTLFVISADGQIGKCNVEDNTWETPFTIDGSEYNFNNSATHPAYSLTGGLVIDSVYEYNDKLYIAYGNGNNIISVSKSDIIDKSVINNSSKIKKLLPNDINLGSAIKSMVFIDGVLYFSSGIYIYCVSSKKILGKDTFVFHTPINVGAHEAYYSEDDINTYFIDKGEVLNGKKITNIFTDGINLIVMGEQGKVGSCSLNTHVWTKCTGIPYGSNSNGAIESNIYNDGTIFKNTITTYINYTNTKLVVFSDKGEVASCNLSTGNWTLSTGKAEVHASSGIGTGPGIYNNGSIINDLLEINEGNVFGISSVCRSGTTVYICGSSGRMCSLNIETGGITCYNGTLPNNAVIAGPGHYYTGDILGKASTITTCITDPVNAILILGTDTGRVISYSSETNEILIPTSTKLYYIGKAGENYDYLSSILVRLTKPNIAEYSTIYPPYEETDNDFISSFESSNYVYSNGNHIWKITDQLDTASSSHTSEKNFKSFEIENKTFSNSSVRSNPYGVVTNNGNILFIVNVNGATKVLYGSGESASWYMLDTALSQKEILSLKVLELENETFVFKNDNGLWENLYIEGSKCYRSNLFNKQITSCTDSNYKVYVFEVTSSGEEFKVYDYSGNGTTFFNKKDFDKTFVDLLGLADISNLNFIDIIVTKNKSITFIFTNNTDIYMISLDFKDINFGYSEGNVELSYKKIELNKVFKSYARNTVQNYTEDLKVNSVNTFIGNNGEKGFLIASMTDNNEKVEISKSISLIVNIDFQEYGNSLVNNSCIVGYKNLKSRVFAFDKTYSKMFVAYYSKASSDDKISNTDFIYVYESTKVIENTPLRPLTNAWKEAQFKLGKETNVSSNANNSLAIHVKFKNNSLEEDDTLDKLYSLRYQILISDLDKGNYILFETEKGTMISSLDHDTKMIAPFLKVIAVDGFEDDIFDLYTSRTEDDVRSFTESNVSGSYSEKTYDFITYLQLKDNTSKRRYQIKIKPINSLPSNVDAEFFIVPYTFDSTKAKINVVNNLEEKNEFASIHGESFAFGNSEFFLRKTPIDEANLIGQEIKSNKEYLPEYVNNSYNDSANADTYIIVIRGKGNGLFTRVSGILTKDVSDSNVNRWCFTPYSIDKKSISKLYNNISSNHINNTEISKNTRGVLNMRNFSVFPKGMINDADYEVDYESSGRITNVNGKFVNKKGLFEQVSSIDGTQKRIGKIIESRDNLANSSNNVYQTEKGVMDSFKTRMSGTAFDIIDRFTINEDPYFSINAWWSQYKQLLQKGNERLLSINENATNLINGLSRKLKLNDKLPTRETVDPIETGSTIVNPEVNGVVSSINGKYTSATDKNIIVTKELYWEKFPFETATGFEGLEMCFIRMYRVTYHNDAIDYIYEVEFPLPYKNIKDKNNNTVVTSRIQEKTNSNLLNILGSNNTKTLQDLKNLYAGSYYQDELISHGVIVVLDSIPSSETLSKLKTITDSIFTIPRTVYNYVVTGESFEGEGVTEQINIATGYYYSTHDWMIYKLEKYVITNKRSSDYNGVYNDSSKFVLDNHNISRIASNAKTVASTYWYSTKNKSDITDNTLFYKSGDESSFNNISIIYKNNLTSDYTTRFDRYPAKSGEIIGTKIKSISVNTVEAIGFVESDTPYYKNEPVGNSNFANKYHYEYDHVDGSKNIKLYRKGLVGSNTQLILGESKNSISFDISKLKSYSASGYTNGFSQSGLNLKTIGILHESTVSESNDQSSVERHDVSKITVDGTVKKTGIITNILKNDWDSRYDQTFGHKYQLKECVFVKAGGDNDIHFFSNENTTEDKETISVSFTVIKGGESLSTNSYKGINNINFEDVTLSNSNVKSSGIGSTNASIKDSTQNNSVYGSLTVTFTGDDEKVGYIGSVESDKKYLFLKRKKISVSIIFKDSSIHAYNGTNKSVSCTYWMYYGTKNIPSQGNSPTLSNTVFLSVCKDNYDTENSVYNDLPVQPYGKTVNEVQDSAEPKFVVDDGFEFAGNSTNKLLLTQNNFNKLSISTNSINSNLLKATKIHTLFIIKHNTTLSTITESIPSRYFWWEVASVENFDNGNGDRSSSGSNVGSSNANGKDNYIQSIINDGTQTVIDQLNSLMANAIFKVETDATDLDASKFKLKVRKCFEWVDGTVIKESVSSCSTWISVKDLVDWYNAEYGINIDARITANIDQVAVKGQSSNYYAVTFELKIVGPNINRKDVPVSVSKYLSDKTHFRHDVSINESYNVKDTIYMEYADLPSGSTDGNNRIIVWYSPAANENANINNNNSVTIGDPTQKVHVALEFKTGENTSYIENNVVNYGDHLIRDIETNYDGNGGYTTFRKGASYRLGSITVNTSAGVESIYSKFVKFSNRYAVYLGSFTNTKTSAVTLNSLVGTTATGINLSSIGAISSFKENVTPLAYTTDGSVTYSGSGEGSYDVPAGESRNVWFVYSRSDKFTVGITPGLTTNRSDGSNTSAITEVKVRFTY
mgnify:CR=1 FL=1